MEEKEKNIPVERKKRRPYLRPLLETQQLFERRTLACVKNLHTSCKSVGSS